MVDKRCGRGYKYDPVLQKCIIDFEQGLPPAYENFNRAVLTQAGFSINPNERDKYIETTRKMESVSMTMKELEERKQSLSVRLREAKARYDELREKQQNMINRGREQPQRRELPCPKGTHKEYIYGKPACVPNYTFEINKRRFKY